MLLLAASSSFVFLWNLIALLERNHLLWCGLFNLMDDAWNCGKNMPSMSFLMEVFCGLLSVWCEKFWENRNCLVLRNFDGIYWNDSLKWSIADGVNFNWFIPWHAYTPHTHKYQSERPLSHIKIYIPLSNLLWT